MYHIYSWDIYIYISGTGYIYSSNSRVTPTHYITRGVYNHAVIDISLVYTEKAIDQVSIISLVYHRVDHVLL